MKKLISMLLVLTMVLSMVGGASLSALADEGTVSEEPGITTDGDVAAPEEDGTQEDSAEPADEVETPADAEDEAPVADEADEDEAYEADEVEETEIVLLADSDEPVDEEETPVADPDQDGASGSGSSGYSQADGFVAGQTYIIVVGTDGNDLIALANDNGTIKTVSFDRSQKGKDSTTLWVASKSDGDKGYLLTNGSYNLYASGGVTATDQSKPNWGYSDGQLYYDGKSKSYVSYSDGALSMTTSGTSVTLYTSGSSTGTASGGDTDTKKEETKKDETTSEATTTSSISAGSTYILVVGTDGANQIVIANNNGTLETKLVDKKNLGEDSTTLWTASDGKNGRGSALKNDGLYLGYSETDNSLIASSTEFGNWNGTADSLYYEAKGNVSYYVSYSDKTLSVVTAAGDTTAVTLYTTSGSTTTTTTTTTTTSGTTYAKANSVDNDYAVFVVNGYTFGLERGSLTYTAVTAANDAVTAADGAYVKTVSTEGGFYMVVNDPPESTVYLYIDETGALANTDKDGTEAPAGYWTFAHGVLAYVNGTTYYVTSVDANGVTVDTAEPRPDTVTIYTGSSAPSKSGTGGGSGSSSTSTITVNESAPQITEEPVAAPYVIVGSGYDAPVYTISAILDENATGTNITFTWYANGEEVQSNKVAGGADPVTDTLVATTLQGLDVGVYPVYCVVSCGPEKDSNTSVTVNFIVTKGVLANSFITFSDVHETFTNLGVAINDTITVHGGMIPALVICTGDWANSYYTGDDVDSDNYNATMDTYISRLTAQVGGIDIVFVSGNHDNSAAARDASIAADLGVAEDYDGTGVIYNSNVETDSVDSSEANQGLIVFGINFESLMDSSYDSGYSYDAVLLKLQSFLEDLSTHYKGELVVISAHAGLHKLSGDGASAKDYNINNADKVVDLLNQYGETMDILFLFGHDHSKGENELFLKPGDTITTVVDYNGGGDNMVTRDVALNFSYGHAGYVTNTIGGQERYSLVTWTDEAITRTMNVANGNSVAELTYAIERVAEPYVAPTAATNTTVAKDNFASAKLNTSDEALLKAVAKYVDGATSVAVQLQTKELTVSKAEQKEIETQATKQLGKKMDNLNYGAFLDITLTANDIPVTQTDGNVSVTITIPQELYKSNYSYKILRIHDGEATLLDAAQDGQTLTFETDRFSTYVLMYEEVAVQNPAAAPDAKDTAKKDSKVPKTGDDSNIALWSVVLIVCAVSLVAVVPKKKRN